MPLNLISIAGNTALHLAVMLGRMGNYPAIINNWKKIILSLYRMCTIAIKT